MAEQRPVLDRYRRLQLLGEGGAGQVWLVEDQLRPGVQLALKEAADGPPERADALRREFVLLARLRHPALVEALELDSGPSDGLPRFTLEYVDGMSLAAAVAEEGPSFCLQMAAEALGVLGFLHDFGLVHRDLKPANIIVRHRARLGCRLVLLDLGLAVQGEVDGPSAGFGGTLPYMAPELFEGGAPGPRSDLYALGALWFEVVHGRAPLLPKADGDLAGFIEAVREGRRARPPLPAGFEEGFGNWIEELLSPDPACRPAGAMEALARLNALTGSEFPVETATSRAARLASDPPPGRGRETGKLEAMLDPEAGPRLVWLAGGAGSGKSRLLNWLRGEMILRGWHVLTPLPGLPGQLAGEDGAARFLRELRSRAARQATLLLLDEVEAADGRLIAILDRLAREGGAPAVQVVAALRPSEATHPKLLRLLDHTGTVPTLRRLDLKPLGKSAIRKLAERATGSSDLSEARLGWLLRASEGEPSIVESLLVEGTWEHGGRVQRSERLESSVDLRIGMLSKQTSDLMASLAVLGPEIGEASLATFTGLLAERARDAIEEARRAGLAQEHEGRWSTASRTVTELVLRRMKEGRRRELHRSAAEMLQAAAPGGESAWKLARLWGEAGRKELALEQAIAAARGSLGEGDPSEAGDRFAYAVQQCAPEAEVRRTLNAERAAALVAGGRHLEAAEAYGAALQMEDERPARADLLGRRAHALVQAGRFPEAREAAEEALGLTENPDLPISGARARKALGVVLGRLGREAEAIPLLTASLEILQKEGDLETVAEALQNRAACKSRLRQKDAADDFHRAIELYRELELHSGELKSLVGLSVLQMRDGNLEEAGELFEEVRRRAVKHGNLDLQETALSKLASLAIEQGRLDLAISLGREALDHARHLGDQNRMMIDRCRLAEALVGCGMPAEAIDLLQTGLKSRLEEVEPDMADFARLLLAQAMLEAPSADDQDIRMLLEKCQQGFRRRRKIRPLMLALVVEMEARSRPGDSAPLDPVRSEFEALAASEEDALEAEIRIRADLAMAAGLMNKGDAGAASAMAGGAAELAGRSGLLAYRARGLALVAAALEQDGKMRQAEESLRESGRLLEEAAGLIEDSPLRTNFINRTLFQAARGSRACAPRGDDRRLLALYDMIRAINSESDPDQLLEAILDMALRAVSAERGMILLRRSPEDDFTLRLARNLDKETEKDAEEYSRGIVAQAGAGRSVLALDAGEDVRFRDLKSVSMYGIRSLMCVPLRSGNRITGTVYLDSRREGTLFTQEDLRFIEAFADHAALALQNARERASLKRENRQLRAVAETRLHYGNLVGRSQAMQQVFQLIEKVAGSELPVLIQGESGTGKELVARAIHFNGARKRRIILSENCAAIPETLLESELFGHVRGAFTGAERDRLGLFEQADGGTLFLDEVGDMSAAMQARLLRALEEGEIRRVGGDRSIKVDVRVIAATHRNLEREVEEGRFREDLVYRLQVLAIRIPPLRERGEDIPLLVDHFLDRIAKERGRERPRIDGTVRAILERYAWPGNVRQLENVLQRLVLLAGEAAITRAELESDASLSETLLGKAGREAPSFSLDRGAREQLRMALEAVGGHRERAAGLLGISRATIYRKIKEFGLK
jgi:transcriptional regulator with GAF, ATPase, and Fis domain